MKTSNWKVVNYFNSNTIDDIRIPRWPWDEWALSHEWEANAGKVAAKIQESYGKLWLVWRKKEVNFKNWKVPELKNICRLEEYLFSTKKEELVELTEKAHELAFELTDDNESKSDVVNAKLVTKDDTIPNPFNLHCDWSSDFSDAPNFAWGDLYC